MSEKRRMSSRRIDLEKSARQNSSTSPSDDAEETLTRTAFLQKAGLLAVAPAALGLVTARVGRASSSMAGSWDSIKAGGTMQIATDQMFSGDSLDPVKSINDGQGIAHGLIRETLTQYDKNQLPLPLLATWSANSRFTEYTLHLRRGVTFHSGKPFTAADAAASIKRVLDPKLGSGLVGRFAPSLAPSGVIVVDPSTLKLKLRRSDSLLMGPLARVLICPADTTNFEDGDGTGPFKLDSWVAGVSCKVSKNPNYWQSGLPYLDGVNLIQISEASTKTESVLSGASDLTEIDYLSVPLIKGKSNVQQILGREFHMVNLVVDETKKPFSDNRVREALKRSIDRQKLIKIAYAGYGTPTADTVVPSDDPQYPRSLDARTKQDLAKAPVGHEAVPEQEVPLHYQFPHRSTNVPCLTPLNH